jgi:hypothetical protein
MTAALSAAKTVVVVCWEHDIELPSAREKFSFELRILPHYA